MTQIGVRIPPGISGIDLEDYLESNYNIRGRLLRELPRSEFSQHHATLGMSYQAITHLYVKALEEESM